MGFTMNKTDVATKEDRRSAVGGSLLEKHAHLRLDVTETVSSRSAYNLQQIT